MKTDIAKLLQKKKKQLLESWMTKQLSDAMLREDLMSNEELREQSNEFLDELLKAVATNHVEDINAPAYEQVKEVLSGISISRAKQGFSPRETGIYVFSLKEAIQQVLKEEISDDIQLLYQTTLSFNKLLDSLGVVTFETYIKGREEVIMRQTDEITEISTPVIQVWEGILALPIIGTLDSARTQVVMENLLQEIVETGSTIAILDISGVPAVDSLVAQHLIKTVAATRLMGAECIISGIRPEIAQTVVHLGIDLSNIVTKSSLASALKYAFGMLKLEVKKNHKEKTTE
ncbi:STAS domain-containing protein [Flavisolibacter ginsengisoli]|jgi:rsbT co-antagonist protein RsbR|uniref:RsbT co-antagonist protein RsbR n=1 Tax=Flavisolibacter ginsengisoli DSM 18119 TaxID=1121884 RepID=A0A1M5GI46_9BACT|nr:STAS domain-containing protein [Flavisolibacter ginsengisoli]SHG03373.1 rsbT co-antagonist protein RsbR [Flavisolibacter ginsengisoli DSM 18119]